MTVEFERFHPSLNFIFFAIAIIGGMCFTAPPYLLASLVTSMAYAAVVKHRIKHFIQLGAIGLMIIIIQPFFNEYGAHVLFRYGWGRAYTLEALLYGIQIAVVFISMMNWFACYNRMVTSDKFIYLFGRRIPVLSLMLTLILRLVPNYDRKIKEIMAARQGLGFKVNKGTFKERVAKGFLVLLTLTGSALEDGMMTSIAMESRGYGSGERSVYQIYTHSERDRFVGLLMAVIIVGMCVCLLLNKVVSGSILWGMFLFIPIGIEIMEGIIWHNLRSKI